MEDTVGMSASSVLLFPEMVLKVSEDGFEADNEVKMMRFLEGKLIVPEVYAYEKEGGKAYLLMSKIKGEAVPQSRMKEIGKEALLLLESVGKELIPSRIELRTRLAWAWENIKNGEADMENCEPETYGKNGFHNPMALWNWLSENAPAEDDLSLTHGDLCLNNLILTKDGIGFFDLGKCALADRNQDIAILLRDIRHQTGIFDEEKFVRETGFAYDKEKIRWYHLLDELF